MIVSVIHHSKDTVSFFAKQLNLQALAYNSKLFTFVHITKETFSLRPFWSEATKPELHSTLPYHITSHQSFSQREPAGKTKEDGENFDNELNLWPVYK